MRILCVICLMWLGATTAIAEQLTVDPARSYVSYFVPFYERGGVFGESVQPDGSVELHYAWHVAYAEERFAIAGSVDIAPLDFRPEFALVTADLEAPSLPISGVELFPDRLYVDLEIGALMAQLPAADTSSSVSEWSWICGCFSWVGVESRWTLDGEYTNGVLSIRGTRHGYTVDPVSVISPDVPVTPPYFDIAGASYSVTVVSSVPEPMPTGLLIMGAPVVAWAARRRACRAAG